jgi:membrane-associated protein
LDFLISSPGYVVLGLLVVFGALGAPLPLTVALAGAGALARQGRLNLMLLFAICVVAAVAGDCLGYLAGRFGIRRIPTPAWAAHWLSRLERSIMSHPRKHGRMGMLIFITRWAITMPAPVVNVVAGARRYPIRSFLAVDVSGEVMWCATALLPGYLLGENKTIGLPLSIAAGLILGAGGLLLSRRVSLARVLRHGEAASEPMNEAEATTRQPGEIAIGLGRPIGRRSGDSHAKRRMLGGVRASRTARFNRSANPAQETSNVEARSA